jgi:hypothetical protein
MKSMLFCPNLSSSLKEQEFNQVRLFRNDGPHFRDEGQISNGIFAFTQGMKTNH